MVSSSSDLTIDELARAAGTPTSTVRMYRQRGLLHEGRKAGRMRLYDDTHVERLRLVADLQERGFSLAAIRELVDTWAAGRGIEDVLGIDPVGGLDATTPTLAADELASLFPGGFEDAALLQRAVDLGLVSPEGDRFRIADPRFTEVGRTVLGQGVPLAEVLDLYAEVKAATDALAARFVALAEDHVWAPFAAAGHPPAELARVVQAVTLMRPLATTLVTGALERSVEQAARDAFARRAGELPG